MSNQFIKYNISYFKKNALKTQLNFKNLFVYKSFFIKSKQNGFMWRKKFNYLETFRLLEVINETKKSDFSMMFIYICTIERTYDKIIKIGYTRKSILERMQDIKKSSIEKYTENGNTVEDVVLEFIIPIEGKMNEKNLLNNLKRNIPESYYLKKQIIYNERISRGIFKVPEKIHRFFLNFIIFYHKDLINMKLDPDNLTQNVKKIFYEMNKKIKLCTSNINMNNNNNNNNKEYINLTSDKVSIKHHNSTDMEID